MTYEKHIRALQLEREFTNGKVCQAKDHKHILATTFSCLRPEPKQAYIINHYQK